MGSVNETLAVIDVLHDLRIADEEKWKMLKNYA